MAFTSTLSLYPHPQPQVRLRHQRLQSLPVIAARFVWLPIPKTRRSHALVVRSASSVEGTPSCAVVSPTVYREFHQANVLLAKQIGVFYALFYALTFAKVIWKLAEKLLVPTPKESKSSTVESQSTPQDLTSSPCDDFFFGDISPCDDVTGYYSGGAFYLEEELEIDLKLLRNQ